MTISDCPPKTVVIDWGSEVMYFRDKADQLVKVEFVESKNDGVNRFQLCCCIAIAQRFYIENSNPTTWNGANDTFLNLFTKMRFGKIFSPGSIKRYWSVFRRGNVQVEYVKYLIINEQTKTESIVTNPKEYGEQFFKNCRGGGYILGSYELEGDKYRFWHIKFDDTPIGEDFQNLYKGVVSILEEMEAHTNLNNEGRMWFEGAEQIKGSRLELDSLLSRADETISIVGQNLYTLVKDEVKALKAGINNKIGFYRNCLESWLDGDKGNRRVEVLMCDPASEESVREYIKKFGEGFIPDLCNSVLRFQAWQREMSSKGFDARVTQETPYSYVIIDAESKNGISSQIIKIDHDGEKEGGERSARVIRKLLHPSKYNNFFEDYHRRYHLCLKKGSTRSIKKVTEDEIAKCKKLVPPL